MSERIGDCVEVSGQVPALVREHRVQPALGPDGAEAHVFQGNRNFRSGRAREQQGHQEKRVRYRLYRIADCAFVRVD